MTLLFAILNSGSAEIAHETDSAPYWIGGGTLLLLLALLFALLAFGKGREHS